MKKYLILIPLLFGLSGCGDSLDIFSKPVEIDVAQPPDPEPVTMLPIQWTIVTKENLDDFITKMTAQSKDGLVFIAITTKDYENIRLNLEDLRRYIEQEQAIIVYYRNITTKAK